MKIAVLWDMISSSLVKCTDFSDSPFRAAVYSGG